MSRRSLLVGAAVVGFAVACRTSATGANASDVAQLLTTDREWAKVSSTGTSADSVLAFWTDDARVLLPGQPEMSGKAAIRKMVLGALKTPGFHITWTPERAAVARSGDLGYTYGANEVTAPDSAGRLVTTPGRYLTVWRKGADGRWRCVQDYSTPASATTGHA